MNQAHNLPINDLINALQAMQDRGISYIDLTIHSPFDIGLKPSEYNEKKDFKLDELNLTDLT